MKIIFTSSIRLTLIFIFSPLQIFPQQQPEYEIIRLGGYGFGFSGMNDSLEIVGSQSIRGSEDGIPILWKNGQIIYLAYNNRSTSPYDINNNSQITGRTNVALNKVSPILWTSFNAYQIIEMPNGFVGRGVAINDNGSIAGVMYATYYDSLRRGFIYDNGLFPLPEAPECLSEFVDINNSGIAVGNRVCSDTIYSAFTYQNGVTFDYGNQYIFTKINNLGHIAGRTSESPMRAVIIKDNIPYIYNNGPYSNTVTSSIND